MVARQTKMDSEGSQPPNGKSARAFVRYPLSSMTVKIGHTTWARVQSDEQKRKAITPKTDVQRRKRANSHRELHHAGFEQLNSQGVTQFTVKPFYVSTTWEPQALKRVENEINLCVRAQRGTR